MRVAGWLRTNVCAQAACLRAVRLGGMSLADYVEVDMRLAYVAQLHGQASSAGRLYYSIMGRSTNNSGR